MLLSSNLQSISYNHFNLKIKSAFKIYWIQWGFFPPLRMRFNQFPYYEISIHTWQLRGTEACEQIYIYLCCDRLFQAQPLHLLLSCQCSFSLWSCHNRLFHASATLPTLFLNEILSVCQRCHCATSNPDAALLDVLRRQTA